jgi:transposase
MAKPYSEDLRLRVIEAVEEGASRREAADRFAVSASSAIWVEQFAQNGSVAASEFQLRGSSTTRGIERSAVRFGGVAFLLFIH